MDAKGAVRIARTRVKGLFGDEQAENSRLEKTELHDVPGPRRITIGSFRPWDMPAGVTAAYAGMRRAGMRRAGGKADGRTCKVVSTRDDGTMASVQQREGLPA